MRFMRQFKINITLVIFAAMAMITFNTADRKVSLQGRKLLKGLFLEIVRFNALELGALSFIFCSDEYLLQINQQYLKHDFYTDIITFDLSSAKGLIDGEIYISVDRVKENAATHAVSVKEELHRVMFHGVLHLCGFKDKTKADKLAMRTAEDFWLSNYFK